MIDDTHDDEVFDPTPGEAVLDQAKQIIIEKKPKPKHKKTNKQWAFVEAYFNNQMNATEAYQSLHPKVGRKVAAQLGWHTLQKIEIRAEIDRRLSEQTMSANEVLKRLSDMAKSNLLPFIRINNDGATYFDFSHPDAKNCFHLIKKLKTKRTRRVQGKGATAEEWEDEWVEVELHDAQTALEKIGKYHGLFIERQDITTGGEKINLNVIYQNKPEKADEDGGN